MSPKFLLALGIAALWLHKWNGPNLWKIASLVVSVLGVRILWFSTIFKQKSQESEKRLLNVWKNIKEANAD
jgi:hypothetical protein